MKLILSITTAATLVATTYGHGYMFEPLSRNYYANLFGLSYGTEPDKAPAEYCPHCLNTKGPGSVCGTSEDGINYDSWLDILGQPMSWNNNGNIYGEGDTITISSFLTAHHTGHAEVRACPMGRASTQDCFDENPLEFVEDIAYGMPKDENHPERGYYYGSSEFNNQEFVMRFKLPDGLVGEEVLLQWWYFTANSCTPEGYVEYYDTNSDLPRDFYNAGIAQCTPEQFTVEFYTGDWPERFINCAEVKIVSRDEIDNIVTDDDGTDDGQLLYPPTPAPVPLSTQAPVPVIDTPEIVPPKPDPSKDEESEDDNSGGSCCSNDYKTCASWCSESQEMCESSACPSMKWLANGALSASETCEPRWGTCTTTGTAGCCEGLVCKGNSPNFKQCLAPNDTTPN